MSGLAYDLERKLVRTLRQGDLARCDERIGIALESLPKSPFHIATGLSFTNRPSAVAAYCDKFFQKETKRFPIAAAYAEMNGFDINPKRWHFSLFAFVEYGGHKDYDWLADWQSEDGQRPLTLTGLEPLQKVYGGAAFRNPDYREASQLCNLLVVVKFQELIRRSAEHMRHRRFPLLATAHDYDFVFELADLENQKQRARPQRRGTATVVELIERLRNPNAIVSARAADALVVAGRRARSAIPVMIDLLQSSNADIRGSVAAALAKLKPLPPEAVTALVDLLADRGTCTLEGQESIPIRFRAAFAIAECAPDRTEIIPVIREALRDRKLVHVRAAAVNAVLGLGAGGRQFVSDLRKQINDSDIRQRARVQYAISLIDPNFRITDEEVRELVETMKHFDEWRRTRLGGKNKGKSHR